jgi:hypothetical protein
MNERSFKLVEGLFIRAVATHKLTFNAFQGLLGQKKCRFITRILMRFSFYNKNNFIFNILM